MSARPPSASPHTPVASAPILTVAGEAYPARFQQRLLPLIVAAGRPIGRSCRGRGVCGACRVEAHGAIEAPSARERSLLERCAAAPGERIACLAVLIGDAQIDSPAWAPRPKTLARDE